MLLSKELNNKITYYLLLAFAFSFPFGNIYGTVLIILISALWLLSGGIFSKLKTAFSKPLFLSFVSLFLIQFLWLINTQDFPRAFYLIQLNASIFVLPLLFSYYQNSVINKNYKSILKALLAGCFSVSAICMVLAVYNFSISGDAEYFFYNQLDMYFFHPGFLSIQMSLCLIALLLDFSDIKKLFLSQKFRIRKLILIFWFILFIALLSSKIGLIALLLILIAATFYSIYKIKSLAIRSGILLMPVLVIALILKSDIYDRVDRAIQSMTTTKNLNQNIESTALRITAIKTTVELIEANWLVGVGTGDVWGDLRRYYFVEGKSGCLKEKVIPHNQYLNSFAKHGVIGLAVLLILLFFPLLKSYQQKNWLAFSFMILLILNCTVEDVFEVQNGVVFSSFFYAYFFLLTPEPEENLS